MTFEIQRTSLFYDEGIAPCEGCQEYIEKHVGTTGTTFTLTKFRKDFSTLEELMEFIESEGEVVISPKNNTSTRITPRYPIIEIYDTYRE